MQRRRTSIVVALSSVTALLLVPGSSDADAAMGAWSQAFSENAAFNGVPAPQTEAETKDIPTAVSMVVLPDGNVAYWNGLQDTESMDAPIILAGGTDDQTSKTRHLDLRGYFASGGASLPVEEDFSIPSPANGDGADLFCSDQRLLADGRVLVVGGTVWVNESEANTNGTPLEGRGLTELYGAKDARIYDYATNEWSNADVPDMEHGRWYPSMVTLADGSMFVAGGVSRLGCNSQLCPGQSQPEFLLPQNVRESETFDPETDTWTQNGDSISLPLYARLRLMPDGKVLYDTTGQAWGPFGEDQDQLAWGTPKLYDPATKTWSDAATASPLDAVNFRSGSFSVMLPMKPPYTQAQILVAGGVMLPSPGAWVATNLSEILTFGVDVDSIVRTATGALNNARWFSSGVGLPTGEVIAFNGADLDEVIFPGLEAAIRQAELFDPDTGTWTPLASTTRDRTYHNSAVLLKDGSVLVGGHSPIVAGYGQDHATYRSNGFKDPTFEIYKPPYLFRGDRPEITSAPSSAARGDTVTIGTPNADSESLSAVLVRLPGVTHVTDADQRTVVLEHTDNGDGSIDVTIPSSGAVVPDGHYYLFLVDDTGEGEVPSIAQIVNVQ